MPLPMVHLSTAVKINILQGVKSPEFYLGSISPDAVHMRDGFVLDNKTRSHCNARVLAAISELDSLVKKNDTIFIPRDFYYYNYLKEYKEQVPC